MVFYLAPCFFSKKIKIKRYRSDSFYKKLNNTNNFINKIVNKSNNLDYYLPIKKQNYKSKLLAHDGVSFYF